MTKIFLLRKKNLWLKFFCDKKIFVTKIFIVTKKKFQRGCVIYLTTFTTITTVNYQILKIYFLNFFGKSNLTHLTTELMFSGQRFAILTMFWLGGGRRPGVGGGRADDYHFLFVNIALQWMLTFPGLSW